MNPATKGVVVVLAGLALTFTLGSLFVLIPVAAELLRPLSAGGSFGWSVSQVSVPFAVAAGSFVVAMIGGGAMQDRLGPRWPSTVGGVAVGLGMIVASIARGPLENPGSQSLPMVIGLGLLVGGGAGLTLACTVPPALKWSVPRHQGLVVGVVVSGLALGPLWLNGTVAQLVSFLGASSMLLVHGVVLLAVIVGLSQLLEDPLPGYVPPGSYSDVEGQPFNPVPWPGVPPRRMIKTVTFRSLWASSALLSASSAFLVVVMVLAFTSRGSGFGAVVTLALGGVFGGLAAGAQQDRAGQVGPWPVVAMLVAALAAGALLLTMGQSAAAAFLVSASCAGGLVLEWVCTTECFGTKSAGSNFGLVFTGGSAGSLLGALGAVLAAGGVLSNLEVTTLTIGVATVFLLALAMAVAFAARVQPPATLFVVNGGRSDRFDKAKR